MGKEYNKSMPNRRNRRTFNRTAKKEEKARVELEKMGLDCKAAREMVKRGVKPEHLKILATGKLSEFMKAAEGKLDKKDVEYLIEKYE